MAGNRKNLSERLLRRRRTDTTVFGDFVYDPGGTLGPRTQRDFQLVFLFSGSVEVRVEETAFTLGPGEVGLLQPGKQEQFTFDPASPTHHGWCAVSPGARAALPEARLLVAAARFATAPISERAIRLLELAFSIPEESSPGLLDSLACAMFEEFLLAVDGQDVRASPPPLPEAVRRARAFVDTRYPEPLDLARLGRAAGVAPKHLGKLFQRHLGTTPLRYLWRVRTTQGAGLSAETGLSAGEIAERVGFQNAFHFSRLVRQAFGVPPRQLRTERCQARAR